jgi:hypothetical protein
VQVIVVVYDPNFFRKPERVEGPSSRTQHGE